MSEESSPGTASPPSAPAPESKAKVLMSQLDWKHLAIGVLTVLGALGYGGVLPTAKEPASAVCPPADPAFQSDVRAALAKLADQQADMRERMARVESALGAGTVR